jgi:hypothetical protein
LSITSLPPTAVLDETPLFEDGPLDDDPELPPQAVASMAAAPKVTSHLKRFIDTLRSPLDHCHLTIGAGHLANV